MPGPFLRAKSYCALSQRGRADRCLSSILECRAMSRLMPLISTTYTSTTSIISEHVAKFEAWRAGLEASSVIDELRGRFRHEREKLLRERLDAQGVSPEERERMAGITEELVERLLAEPATRLRHGRGTQEHLSSIHALRRIFGLAREGESGEEL